MDWKRIYRTHRILLLGVTALAIVVFVLIGWADRVVYVDADGVVHTVNAETLTGGGATTLEAGTYVVCDDITYTGTVTLTGDVTLILSDGCTMTVDVADGDGIKAFDGSWNSYSLTIYGQEEQSGMLCVHSPERGIWCGALVVNGGVVSATTDEWQSIAATDSVVINRGVVMADNKGSKTSAIQGDKNVTINGGKVTAQSGGVGISTYEGDINLGYKQHDDFITSSSFLVYFGTVRIGEGMVFSDGCKTYTSDTESSTLSSLKHVTLKAEAQASAKL